MRDINTIVIHCSATPPSADIGVAEIDSWHRSRGFNGIGYHYVIRRGGYVEQGRSLDRAGAHARGHNAHSIGVCLVGGVDSGQAPDCNFTRHQFAALSRLVDDLLETFGPVKVVGHRDLSPDTNGDGTIQASERIKACPCFDVGEWMDG
ncbi:N-acetylmuramoyl-L-alanine amidase [Litorivivens sp.]|uniref:N-acetylmuramoyl-L-alanine amidase n=1 Tax=Litorivivens sp. TaxID=2020868 RepID=UPI003561AD7C